MKELIKVSQTENGKIVSARNLYQFLGIQTDFTDWCKRMFDYGFDKDVDYAILLKNEDKPISKSNPINYAFKLDMAKEISMIQRSEKGKQARQYFIECEKELKANSTPSYQIEDTVKRAERWIEEEKERRILLESNAKLQFRSDFVDVCFDADGVFSMEEVCKILKLDYGRNTMMSKLREKRIFLKSNTPKQEFVSRGYFKVVEKLLDSGSFKKLVSTTYATQKGIGYIHKILNDEKSKIAQ